MCYVTGQVEKLLDGVIVSFTTFPCEPKQQPRQERQSDPDTLLSLLTCLGSKGSLTKSSLVRWERL